MRMRLTLVAVIFGFSFSLAWSSTVARSIAQDKPVRYVVGMGPGGGFDLYARLLARHMGKYLPGSPSIIVQNVPGAGSLVAANLIYKEEPGDRLTMVMLHFGAAVQALLGLPQARFDPFQYVWIGDVALGGLPRVIWMRSDLPIKTLDDFRKAEKPWHLGSTGVGTADSITAELLKRLGYPVEAISGYKASSDVMAALERKELDGYAFSQATMMEVFRHYVDRGVVRPVLAFGREPRVAPLPGVPFLDDMELPAKERALLEFFANSQAMLRVHAVPPGTPPNRVKILREAFMKALQDPALLREAEKMKITISPTSGEEVTRTVEQLAKAPPEIKQAFRLLMGLK